MRHLLENWRHYLPFAGIGVAVLVAAYFLLYKREPDPDEIERERRIYLNRIGRIVEGQILEIEDKKMEPKPEPRRGLLRRRSAGSNGATSVATMLLHYTYSISGVTYETAQDITGIEQTVCLKHAVVGQAASVKYDPSNPSNSILIAEDWSGLH
ncbi:MAG TPA: DUF3592 domain-containing protein [Candidatus Acidoferrales bacterium]|nr:DUF3592 domain-containing protein [Candidatus Acidoferrales bacterium]